MLKYKQLILFIVGGSIYFMLETLWRGFSHSTMFALGGFCFVLIGLLNEYYTFNITLYKQQIGATFIVTLSELCTGIILNRFLGLGIWDYSNLPFNFMGQICLQYSIAWFFLSAPAIILDDYLRYWFFSEEKPHYKLF